MNKIVLLWLFLIVHFGFDPMVSFKNGNFVKFLLILSDNLSSVILFV